LKPVELAKRDNPTTAAKSAEKAQESGTSVNVDKGNGTGQSG